MGCGVCGAEIPEGTIGPCVRCGTPLPLPLPHADGATMMTSEAHTRAAQQAHRASLQAAGILAPGTAFGGRYHVIRLLGAGGMGAVYQAWDNELGVAVALKVIRPEVMVDPDGARDLERRFKRELLLARQVTHKNVVRIHDLGEVDGTKYITMPYIQGVDLATVLHREGKLPVPKVIGIAKQVAHGLAAAHEAGVVHRDLKPANIMIDEDDRAIIMDFGIARSTSGGATMIGTVVGTLEYMAPEQALGQPVDHRADIYTFGLILYDLVLGRRSAARAESAVAELMNRMQRSLPPIRSVDAAIPEPLEAIISSCMQPDPALRFQTTPELVAALECLDRDGGLVDPSRQSASSRLSRSPFALPTQPQPAVSAPAPVLAAVSRRSAAAVVAVVAILAGGYVVMRPVMPGASPAATAATEHASIAVLPFRNATGEPSLDWVGGAAAEMLEGALRRDTVRVLPAARLGQVMTDLRITRDTRMDPGTLKRLSEFTNATTLIAGEYLRADGQIRMEAVLHDVRRGTSERVSASVADKPQMIAAVTIDAVAAIGRGIDEKLTSAGITRRAANSTSGPWRPSTASLDAFRLFSEGMQASRNGNHLEAVKRFEAAVQADPAFALAHASLAQSYSTLGKGPEAQQASRRAVEHAANLPPRERYQVEATHARVLNDPKGAVEAYERLLPLTPDDPEVHFRLAGSYESMGNHEKAQAHYLKVIETDPKYFDALFAAGRVEILRKDPERALDYLSRALNVAIAVDKNEARASALHATGIAYKRLNKLEDARRYYNEALVLRERLDDKRGMASTLSELGGVQDDLGSPTEALASYKRSLALREELKDMRGLAIARNNLGVLFQSLGQLDEALKNYRESLQLQTELGNADFQGQALHNIGNTLIEQGNFNDAAHYLARALLVREKLNVPAATAETLRSHGELRVRMGEYEQGLRQYVNALELSRNAGDRRGAALALGGTASVFEEQGRYRAALDARREALQGLRDAKESGTLLVEALAAHAHAWSLVSRHDQARGLFEEAVPLAEKLAKPRLIGFVIALRGEDALLAGRPSDALPLLTQAVPRVEAASDPYLALRAKLQLAKAQLRAGRSPQARSAATAVASQASRLGMKALAADAAITAGEASVTQSAPARVRTELEAALREAETLGVRPLTTRAHHALATALRSAGQPEAAEAHRQEAERLLGELQKEAGSESLAKRSDLSDIAASAARRSPASD